MLQRFAGAGGGQGGARSSHESQTNARPRAEPNDLDLLANLSPVPEEDDGEDDEESAGGVTAGRGDCLHEHQAGIAATHAGFCRDHRGKLQSVWELCEDVAPEDCNDVQDADQDAEADDVLQHLLAAAETRGDQNRVHLSLIHI